MNTEKEGFCKPDSLQRRLRLRKNDKESINNEAYVSDNSNNKNKDDTACTSQSLSDDDSILDFKSPKRLRSAQSKDINRLPNKAKKKKLLSKVKIVNNEKKSKSGKLLQSKKIHRDVQQPLIESSFFKSEKKEVESPQSLTDVKTAYVCPLCLKNLKDENSQTAHMKICATKNNVSTKKLMDAMELQERQAAERKSLGLLSAPLLQDKKKPAPRKMASCDDPDLQLALALSKSLYEKEEIEEWDDVQIVAISSNPSVSDNNIECPQKTTLQDFGFSSDRNTLPINNSSTNKTRKRKLIEPTILQRRTTVERERILTERIAEILMGCKDFTQRSQEKAEESNDINEKIVLRSDLLKQLHKTESTLWDRTKLILTQDIFYVKQLSSQIIPLEKKGQELNEEQNLIKLEEVNERRVSNEKSLDNEQIQEIKKIDIVKIENNEALISSNTINMCCKEKKFLDNLATNWRNMLNDSSASDIIVFVKNNRHIWAHKLVFYTRCSNILLDVIPNDTEYSIAKEKICWFDTDYDVALAFLEFVYCGMIDRHSKIFDSETSLSGVRALGRKYKIHDLFIYLRQKKSNVTEVKHDYNTCEKSTENIYPNVEMALNISKLDESFNSSKHDVVENIQCSQKVLLQEDDDLCLLKHNCISTKNLCVSQDEKTTLIKSKEINSRSNTPTRLEITASPDMFDDTPIMKHNDKSIVCSKDVEDSNIHILLSLIKQDADIDISSKKLLKTQNAEYKDIPTCSKNMEQNVIEIDSDPESNSLKFSTDNMDKNSLIDTPQSSKPKYIQNYPSEITKQKSNLSLFIEKIQKENAKLDAVLDSNKEYLVEIQKNSFNVDSHNLQSHTNNVKQSIDTEKRPGRLTIIEQHIQSFATKNPEFYSRLSKEQVENVNSTHINSPKIIESSHKDTLNCTQNFTTSNEKHINISEKVTTVSAVCSQHFETMNQSLDETCLDLETNEEDISMYSKYIRNHKDNSIAKYRRTISRNKSDSNVFNKSTLSDLINVDNNINEVEKDDILTQRVLTQKDADVIVSSDTDTDADIESTSFNVSHIVNYDSNHENTMSYSRQSRKETEDNKQDVENENKIQKCSQAFTTNTEEEIDINSVTKSNQDKLNTTELRSITQKSGLNDDQRKEFVSSPITVCSSPDLNNESYNPVLNMESLLQNEHYTENIPETSACKSREPMQFSFNFYDNIYLANVDVDKYENLHILEKSQSFNALSTTELKNGNARKSNNKNNHKNIKGKDTAADDYRNLNSDVTSLTQNVASIRKFKRKSLSEGQIDTNRLRNKETTSTCAAMQFHCKYTQDTGNANTLKIIDKDVTPPPDYDHMSTPELHKEMKKYGLKVQKRSRAVKLLTHIYNELHPLVPEEAIGQQITEISSDEDEGPPSKKRNIDNNSLEKSSNTEDSGNELPCSQDSNDSTSSAKETINQEMQFYETMSPALENSLDIVEAFTKLINIDKDLHNKILRYEPVNIEQLRSTMQTYGFKCKLSNLMSFLDQQCITFYVPEQNVKNRARTRKKT